MHGRGDWLAASNRRKRFGRSTNSRSVRALPILAACARIGLGTRGSLGPWQFFAQCCSPCWRWPWPSPRGAVHDAAPRRGRPRRRRPGPPPTRTPSTGPQPPRRRARGSERPGGRRGRPRLPPLASAGQHHRARTATTSGRPAARPPAAPWPARRPCRTRPGRARRWSCAPPSPSAWPRRTASPSRVPCASSGPPGSAPDRGGPDARPPPPAAPGRALTRILPAQAAPGPAGSAAPARAPSLSAGPRP